MVELSLLAVWGYMKHISLIFLFLLASGNLSAQTIRYITDESKFPLRSGKSTENRILQMVPSGTAVTVLEDDPDGYTRVKISKGSEGWLLSRYLMEKPSGREQLAGLHQEYASLQAKGSELKEKLETLNTTKLDIERRNGILENHNLELLEELKSIRSSAARPIEISRENQELQQRLDQERETAQELRNENDRLREETNRNWFLTGAGVVLGGFLLGLIIPRIPWRKRRSWDEI
jgi:SH3 domain protein